VRRESVLPVQRERKRRAQSRLGAIPSHVSGCRRNIHIIPRLENAPEGGAMEARCGLGSIVGKKWAPKIATFVMLTKSLSKSPLFLGI
jgi:hypothetical protein